MYLVTKRTDVVLKPARTGWVCCDIGFTDKKMVVVADDIATFQIGPGTTAGRCKRLRWRHNDMMSVCPVFDQWRHNITQRKHFFSAIGPPDIYFNIVCAYGIHRISRV
jgi:hypothetical protein